MYSLVLLSAPLVICRLDAQSPFPLWAQGSLVALVRTATELSVVCEAGNLPEGVQIEPGWRALGVQGPLDFTLVGVLAELSSVLARAGISIFVVSTYDTDYILVKEAILDHAVQALQKAGHLVQGAA